MAGATVFAEILGAHSGAYRGAGARDKRTGQERQNSAFFGVTIPLTPRAD
jgi:hypothetical protein